MQKRHLNNRVLTEVAKAIENKEFKQAKVSKSIFGKLEENLSAGNNLFKKGFSEPFSYEKGLILN